MLKKLDPARAKIIDAQNPRRLIRAIEIACALKKDLKNNQSDTLDQKNKVPYSVLTIGLAPENARTKKKNRCSFAKEIKEWNVK